LHSSVKVHEVIELLFWVVSGVSPGTAVLDGNLNGKGRFFGRGVKRFSRPLVWMVFWSSFVTEKWIRLMHQKFIIFPFGQKSMKTLFICLS